MATVIKPSTTCSQGCQGPREGRAAGPEDPEGLRLRRGEGRARWLPVPRPHHFASWFMMRGGRLQALKELLGYQDIKTTLIYAHLSPAHLRAEITKTDRFPGTKLAHSDSAIEGELQARK